jgi:hypothetical protein
MRGSQVRHLAARRGKKTGPRAASLNAMKAMTPTMMQSTAFATELLLSGPGAAMVLAAAAARALVAGLCAGRQ